MKTWYTACLVLVCIVSCNLEAVSEKETRQNIEARKRGEARGKAMVRNAALCEERSSRTNLSECLKACDLGHSNSCAHVALAKEESHALEEAAKFADLACRGGSGVGCEYLGSINHDESLLSMARTYHRVHCEQGYKRSCRDLAEMYKRGIGGNADDSTATHFESLANR